MQIMCFAGTMHTPAMAACPCPCLNPFYNDMIFLRHKYMRRSKILRVWIISMKFSKRLMASLFLEETWELTFHQKIHLIQESNVAYWPPDAPCMRNLWPQQRLVL
ncbi:uncharacterized protein LOC120706964 [Panicum virgatum]|uniref:Uncharacterized protein n=1 Tax=Panicum virgatum TaxID=38727 RepID=A0A8T0SHF9_PANVG|nr:uncharacterized protein LOC120706964 [Panicum virgatum]KAG2597830.1 hypothetical protein PVAP13_5KG397707 [Panicum virgatum]